MRRAHLIFNPAPGHGDADDDLTVIREALEPDFVLNVHMTGADRSIGEQVRTLLGSAPSDSGPADPAGEDDLVIAAGGDGTVSAAAGPLLETGITLGILPRGTSNAFARALGIPGNLKEACETIVRGETRVVDAGRLAGGSGGSMILMATIGIGAWAVADAPRVEKDRFGPLAYLWSAARQMTDQEPFLARFNAEERSMEVELSALTIANVAPPTSILAQGCGEVIPDDGRFEVTLAFGDEVGLAEVASLMASAIRSSEAEAENILCFRTPAIRVVTEPRQAVVVDGEEKGSAPLEVRCVPGALNVVVP